MRLIVCAIMCFLFGLFVSHFYLMWQDVVVFEPRPRPIYAFSLSFALSLPLFLYRTHSQKPSFISYGLPLIVYGSLVLSGLLFIYDVLYLSPASIEPALAIWPCVFMGTGASALFVFLTRMLKNIESTSILIFCLSIFILFLGTGWGVGDFFWQFMNAEVVKALTNAASTNGEVSIYAHLGGLLFITQLSVMGYLATFFLWE